MGNGHAHGPAFACLLIDIDYFRRVNDTHGHDVGDKVLQQTAQILRDTARAHDVISRLGGEEFLVVCPNTSSRGAQACGERLRTAVEAALISVGPVTFSITVSIGVAVWNKSVPNCEALLKAADVAVYAAKEAGRNRSCFLRPAPKRSRKKASPLPQAIMADPATPVVQE